MRPEGDTAGEEPWSGKSGHGGRVFSPKKFSAAAVASIGGDLWGYLEGGQAHADYYLDPNGIPTSGRVELHGGLFERLGVTNLDRDVFVRLAAGCHPVSGERLVQTSHVPTSLTDPSSGRVIVEGGFHVPGIDCNFSPPKSVSALLPFLSAEGRAELEEVHLAAVRGTLRELEAQVPLCRPTVNGEQVHAPGELGIAVFTHHTSRPSPEVGAQPGRPPDPQLHSHSHAFLFNLAWCQGRFLAIDSKPLLRFASTVEAIYTCELAAQLQQLGYRLRWQQTRRGPIFDLEGVDPRVIELFSSRHRHIQQLADQFQAARGRPPTPIERRHLAARDRAPKTAACHAPHWPTYRQVLRDRGLPEPPPHRHRHRPAPVPLAEREAAVRARLLAPDGLTRNDATFDSASLTKTAFQAAAGLLNVAETRRFLERFLAGVDLVPVTTPAGLRLTTQALLNQEHAILATANAKAHTMATAPAPAVVERTVAEVEARAGYRLSDEQRAALEHLCALIGWASLVGHAGTDKTTTVRAVVRAYEHNHRPVFLVSTAADTAHRTAGELDLHHGRVTIRCDDGHTLMLQTSNLHAAQPLRLAYAVHALKLQGGQADVVLVLPGSWQTSRQSAYSMATRCVQELHVFIDTQTQSTGAYRDRDPIDVLAARWTTDAKKLPASPSLHPDEHRRSHLTATPVHGVDLQLHSDARASPSRSEGHWTVTPWSPDPHTQTDRQAVDDLEISLGD